MGRYDRLQLVVLAHWKRVIEKGEKDIVIIAIWSLKRAALRRLRYRDSPYTNLINTLYKA